MSPSGCRPARRQSRPRASGLLAGGLQGLNDLIVSRGIKKYSQMKLRMCRGALEKVNRQAGERARDEAEPMSTVRAQWHDECALRGRPRGVATHAGRRQERKVR